MMSAPWLARLEQWDHRLFYRLFHAGSASGGAGWMRGVSRSADGWLYPAVLFPAAALGGATERVLLLAALPGFVLERMLYRGLKSRFRRRRPFHRLADVRHRMAPPDEFSFPSGHTAAAFLFASLVVSAWPALAVPMWTWAFAVGVSRVGLGVHFPADTVAGACLGVSCAAIGRLVAAVLGNMMGVA